jgi:hypothetical protein
MAITIKYFNSFVLKKTVNLQNSSPNTQANSIPVFTGLPWNPTHATNAGYPAFITSSQSSSATGLDGRAKYTNTVNENKRNWIIEESRIRGGYNNTDVGYSPRAYLREETNEGEIKENALIYSGVYNSLTGLNETNVFSVGEQITKATDPINGSIQKLHALDTNLAIFQENKVSSALIDKDAIYSAEGSGTVTSANLVIGQITPYVGEYGISKNPESFAYFGYRRYFTDKYRNAVMRLSRDGMTEISQYGMRDFFRDKLGEINDDFFNLSFTSTYNSFATSPNNVVRITSNLDKLEKGLQVIIPQSSGPNIVALVLGFFGSTNGSFLDVFIDKNPGAPSGSDLTFNKFIKEKVLGGFDNYNDNYVLSIQKHNNFTTPTVAQDINTNFYTVSFDESVNGWTSFYTYKPSFIFSLKNNTITSEGSDIYLHYSNENRNEFYGVSNNSNITFVFNANPSIIKNFKTINYEGDSGWEVNSVESDRQGSYFDQAKAIKSYDEGLYTQDGIPYRVGFTRKENKYFANLVNNSSARPGEVVFGSATTGIKGYLATVKISTDATTDPGGSKELFAVSTEFVVSSR